MKTPYIKHYFGNAVEEKLKSRIGWLTAGVASSIPWPKSDVWIIYNGDDFIIRGTESGGQKPSPGITVPCQKNEANEALRKIYKLTSVLSWFMRGYVDVSGHVISTHPMLYGDPRNVFSNLGVFSDKQFNCNHMPIIEDENARKALAFWREGCRLIRMHDSYAFLSFYKVIESQFADGKGKQRGQWINANIDHLNEYGSVRVQALRKEGIDVSKHIFESGRCAVAHASLDGEIVDPDIPEDRRRIAEDLDLMQSLAHRYISHDLGIPDEMSLYETRNRLEPLKNLLTTEQILELSAGGSPNGLEKIDGMDMSVGIWPENPMTEFKNRPIQLIGVSNGVVHIRLWNLTGTIFLEFALDFPNGKAHTQLGNSGLQYNGTIVTEDDVIAFTTYFNKVLGNQITELCFPGCDPIDCEVVIPVNMMPMTLDEALEVNLKQHKEILIRKSTKYF